MAVRPLGGYDPGTGWPPDDSTGIDWGSPDEPVDLPGILAEAAFTVPMLASQAPLPAPRAACH